VRNNYQRKERKSNHKFEVVRGQELLQAQVEELTGQAGLQILRAILENEVTRRVGPPHRPNPSAGCVRWEKQPGYVVFGAQKIPLERPRVRTREGQEVELESYGQLQQDGKLQRAVRERTVAGLSYCDPRRLGHERFYAAEGEWNLVGKYEGRSPVTALRNLRGADLN
jgi:hypothetical protein